MAKATEHKATLAHSAQTPDGVYFAEEHDSKGNRGVETLMISVALYRKLGKPDALELVLKPAGEA